MDIGIDIDEFFRIDDTEAIKCEELEKKRSTGDTLTSNIEMTCLGSLDLVEEFTKHSKQQQLIIEEGSLPDLPFLDNTSRPAISSRPPRYQKVAEYVEKTLEKKPVISRKKSAFANRNVSILKYFEVKKNEAKEIVDSINSCSNILTKLPVFTNNDKELTLPARIPSEQESSLPTDLGAPPTWKYLLTSSFRRYQFDITKTALCYNTLVCLPTGLGKTFIATNVILNYYNWFPTGKIFFLAPTKPLAAQQLAGLAKDSGLDPSDVSNLDGGTPAKVRCRAYVDNRVFFMTPQTLENDLDKNRLSPESIVLLIIGYFKR